jgi:hypothetical protein
MKKINNKTIGYLYIITGFLIIITNAIQYFFSNYSTLLTTMTIGLALVVVGLFYSKKEE